MYKCADCGAEVTLVDGVLVKTCEHAEAAVLADMQATVHGDGGAK